MGLFGEERGGRCGGNAAEKEEEEEEEEVEMVSGT